MNSQRPFDLGKLDFDAIRLAKRRKLLRYSLPISVIAIIICVKLLSVPVLSFVAHNSYKNSQHKSATQWLLPLYVANWIEPYKLPFNHGNALFKQGDYQAAEGRYREALERVPEQQECSVRINLALSIEAQADTLIANKSYDDAILRYDDMKAVLYDGEDSCGVQFNETSVERDDGKGDEKSDEKSNDKSGDKDGDNDGDKDGDSDSGEKEGDKDAKDSKEGDADRAKKIMKRAQEKSSSAKRQRNGDEADGDGNSQDDAKNDNSSTQEKLDKLEQQSRNAQKERSKRSADRQSYDDYEKNDRSYDSKNW